MMKSSAYLCRPDVAIAKRTQVSGYGYAANKHGVRDSRVFVPLSTSGWLPDGKPAYVYVLYKDFRAKIGMSTSPSTRSKVFRMPLVFTVQVISAAARHIETEALRLLGQGAKQPELLICAQDDAVRAVRQAFDIVGRRMHVDPGLTPELARKQRVGDDA